MESEKKINNFLEFKDSSNGKIYRLKSKGGALPYIGILGKDNKKLYYGDIIDCEETTSDGKKKRYYFVDLEDGKFFLNWLGNKEKEMHYFGIRKEIPDKINTFEILGNIYQTDIVESLLDRINSNITFTYSTVLIEEGYIKDNNLKEEK